jgi:exopolysaccharide production protein ExoZ
MKELYNIQMLRALAVLLVALYHLEGYASWIAPITRHMRPFGYSGVDLFFVISGFINYYVSIPKLGNCADSYPFQFLLKRFIRIFPNYWIFVTACLPLVFYYGMHPLPQFIEFELAYLLVWPLRVTEQIMITGWTLNYEWLFYLFFAFTMLMPRHMWWLIGTHLLAVIIVQNEIDHGSAARLWEFAYAPYFFQFYAGMAIAWLAHHKPMPFPRAMIAIGTCFFALAWWMQVSIYPETFGNPLHRDLRCFVFMCAYAPVVYGFVALERDGIWQCQNKLLIHWGDASYTLYLLFMPYFFVCTKLWQQYLPELNQSWQAYLIFTPVVFISYLLLGSLHSRYIERPMIGWLKKGLVKRRAGATTPA